MIKKKASGFTLIELLVVISVIGLLSSIVIVSLTSVREKARIAAGQAFDSSVYHSVGDDMIAYFPFDGSPQNLGGTAVAGFAGSGAYPTYITNDSPYGKGSIKFNGGRYLSIPLSDLSETSSTVSFWYKSTDSVGAAFWAASGGGADRQIYTDATSGTCVRLYGLSPEPTEILCYAVSISDGKWHHFVHTFGGSVGGQEIWIDGKKVKKGVVASSGFTAQTHIYVGVSVVGNQFFGQISDLRIYTRAIGG